MDSSSAAQDQGRGLLSAATMARRFHEFESPAASSCGVRAPGGFGEGCELRVGHDGFHYAKASCGSRSWPNESSAATTAACDAVADKMGLHFASNPYLTFQDMTPEGRLTRIVEVIAVRSGDLLGVIRWFGAWRQYVFAPEPECVFNVGCMKTIERNVGVLNAIQKGRL